MFAVSLFGQASASLNGRVTDPQRGPVAGAAVTVTNDAGGTARDTVTNSEGLYNVPSLVPGNYNIKVTAQGFSANETKGVELLTGSDLSVDIQMSLGTLQQTISVQPQAALVESSQSTQDELRCRSWIASCRVPHRRLRLVHRGTATRFYDPGTRPSHTSSPKRRHDQHNFILLASRPRVYRTGEIRAWIRNSGAAPRRFHGGLSAEIPAVRCLRRRCVDRLASPARLPIPKEPRDSGQCVRESGRLRWGIRC